MPNNATVHARFTDTISSLASRPGDPVTAIVTEPLLDAENKLIIPQGTLLHGEVQRATPSRWFGRGGQLRFRFTSVELPTSFSAPQPLSGQLVAAEGPADARLARPLLLRPLAIHLLPLDRPRQKRHLRQEHPHRSQLRRPLTGQHSRT